MNDPVHDDEPMSIDDVFKLIDEALASGKVRMQFWTCPDHSGRVTWEKSIATCAECGRTNHDGPSR